MPVQKSQSVARLFCKNSHFELERKDNMKKSLKIMCVFFFFIGLALWFAKLVMPYVLPDFVSGLLDGMSTAFILIGLVYMGWCLGKRKTPLVESSVLLSSFVDSYNFKSRLLNCLQTSDSIKYY